MDQKPWYHEGLRFECTMRQLLRGGSGFRLGEPRGDRRPGGCLGETAEAFEEKYVRKIGVRKSLREFPNGDCVFFDCDVGTVGVRRPTTPVSHMAVLGLQPANAGGLAADLRGLPRQWPGGLYQLDEIEQVRQVIRM